MPFAGGGDAAVLGKLVRVLGYCVRCALNGLAWVVWLLQPLSGQDRGMAAS